MSRGRLLQVYSMTVVLSSFDDHYTFVQGRCWYQLWWRGASWIYTTEAKCSFFVYVIHFTLQATGNNKPDSVDQFKSIEYLQVHLQSKLHGPFSHASRDHIIAVRYIVDHWNIMYSSASCKQSLYQRIFSECLWQWLLLLCKAQPTHRCTSKNIEVLICGYNGSLVDLWRPRTPFQNGSCIPLWTIWQ